MKRKKLLEAIKDLLGEKQRGKRRRYDELKKLLKKLKEKEVQLEEKMLLEKDKPKRKRLGKELEIVKAQYAKGLNALQSLETS